jgi:hypothetical protein
MAMFTMTLVALVAAAGVADADPEAPQAGAPCWGVDGSGAMENAQTFTPQHEVLICVKNDQGSQWQHLDDIQRPVETWFTYGPEQTLAAADILPAMSWVSASGRVEDVCTAVQTPADGGPPVTHTNNSGYYRDFALIANLATLKLSGYCDWRKAWQRAPG